MLERNYRPLQMHRIAYGDLTEAQIADIIKPTAARRWNTASTPRAGAVGTHRGTWRLNDIHYEVT